MISTRPPARTGDGEPSPTRRHQTATQNALQLAVAVLPGQTPTTSPRRELPEAPHHHSRAALPRTPPAPRPHRPPAPRRSSVDSVRAAPRGGSDPARLSGGSARGVSDRAGGRACGSDLCARSRRAVASRR